MNNKLYLFHGQISSKTSNLISVFNNTLFIFNIKIFL